MMTEEEFKALTLSLEEEKQKRAKAQAIKDNIEELKEILIKDNPFEYIDFSTLIVHRTVCMDSAGKRSRTEKHGIEFDKEDTRRLIAWQIATLTVKLAELEGGDSGEKDSDDNN